MKSNVDRVCDQNSMLLKRFLILSDIIIPMYTYLYNGGVKFDSLLVCAMKIMKACISRFVVIFVAAFVFLCFLSDIFYCFFVEAP